MEPILYILLILWIFALAVCCGWWFSCCLCGLCCPIKLQRFLAVLAVVLFVVSILGTAAATHRLQRLVESGGSALRNSIEAVRVTGQIVKELKNRNS